jgi:HK97 family phage major capsid protein
MTNNEDNNQELEERQLNTDTIQTGTFYRDLAFNREEIDVENRTVSLAFSSENPVERFFGEEILSHDPSAVRMGRLKDGGALLVDHDARDIVGIVESADIGGDRRGRATVRFGNSTRASEVWQDVQDGIRRHVSVGYVIHELQQDAKRNSDGLDSFRAVDWEPLEVSLVSIPADNTVGVGRSLEQVGEDISTKVLRTESSSSSSIKIMSDNDNIKDEQIVAPVASSPSPTDVRVLREDVRRGEMERINSIEALGSNHNNVELAREFIGSGKSVDDFKGALLERVAKPVASKDADAGLSDSEVKQFSFRKAINALANPHDRRAQEEAAFEFEASRAAADKAGVETRGLRVPNEVLKRDNTVGSATGGGHLVGEDTTGFIDRLTATSIAMQRGTTLGGLVGDVAIPRMTGGATAYWLAESGAPTESAAAFDQVNLSPNTVAGYIDISRKLSKQSSVDVESLIRNDLARSLGLAIDAAAINGAGTDEPLGILGQTGIGAVAGGAAGAAPTWAHLVDLESAIAQDNALGGDLAYWSNYVVSGKLKQTEKTSGVGDYILDGNGVNGYNFELSNQIPSTLTKGVSGAVCSAIIFGNFADLIIGMWGGLDLTVDPYSESTKGTIRVVAFQDMDIALRHAESFAAMQDVLTA